jgi:surface antigen
MQPQEAWAVRLSLLPFLLTLATALSGCSTFGGGAMSQEALALRAGILAGELGEGLPENAKRAAADAEYRALEGGAAGAPVTWKISDTVQGNVVPQQPYAVGSSNCRRYTHTVSFSGQIRNAVGTACRREDGVWRPLA